MTEMQKIIEQFVKNCESKNKLNLDNATREKLVIALENMGKKKQKGGVYYIPDDEMEDLILNYEDTIKEYYVEEEKKTAQKPISQPKTAKPTTAKVVKNELFDDLDTEESEEETETDTNSLNVIEDDDLFGETKPKAEIPTTKWESLELF